MEIPDPQYLETHDGAYIAYQAVGEGPIDIAWQFEFGGNLDVWWELPWVRRWFEGLASFGRLILHDPRGVGLSSRNVPLPNLETRTDDLRAVLDEVGSASAVIGGWFEGLAPGVLLAAGDPSPGAGAGLVEPACREPRGRRTIRGATGRRTLLAGSKTSRSGEP